MLPVINSCVVYQDRLVTDSIYTILVLEAIPFSMTVLLVNLSEFHVTQLVRFDSFCIKGKVQRKSNRKL
jgi:hypothetical protein